MSDPRNDWGTAPDRLEAQWVEHRRLEAVVAAVKRGQQGITLRPFDPAGASPLVPEVGGGLQAAVGDEEHDHQALRRRCPSRQPLMRHRSGLHRLLVHSHEGHSTNHVRQRACGGS